MNTLMKKWQYILKNIIVNQFLLFIDKYFIKIKSNKIK